MALKDNIEYWQISLEHPEMPGEDDYIRDIVIIEKEDYCQSVNLLRQLITTYCTLIEINKKSQLDEIAKIIDSIICNIENIQYTEFISYWKCLDTTYSIYRKLDEGSRLNTLKAFLKKYCENRGKLYDRMGYTHVIQQALYDSASARSQSVTGRVKVKRLLNSVVGEVQVAWSEVDFGKDVLWILFPDENKDGFTHLMQQLNVKYQFGKTHQGKLPDVVIKIGESLFVLEAKHVKESGGAQDKQIKELIDFIMQRESNEIPIYYVAFLDGTYFNRFIKPRNGTKLYNQLQAIEEALRQYKRSYFVNTAGLTALLEDACQTLQGTETSQQTSTNPD
jgi:hypothetical protein